MSLPPLEQIQRRQVAFTLVQSLDVLRDGLRPFVLSVLKEKEGSEWFNHPRIQKIVPVPPALEGEPAYGPEGPNLDLALLLKLIGSDSYWYRTFRTRLSGISRWQIDSLRELRNRVAHNDGEDPLLTNASLALPYLATMEQLLRAIDSSQWKEINSLRSRLQRSRRYAFISLVVYRSKWSIPFWLVVWATVIASAWFIDYGRSTRIERKTLVIGTPDRRLERYIPLEQYLEDRLRPAHVLQALLGERIDVRIEGAQSYPEAVANLKAQRWDVVLGFSPVVSMEAISSGYRTVGRMFPDDQIYSSILFTRRGSSLASMDDITESTRIALGDFFSATKYYVPMSLLRGRSARIKINLSTSEIAEQVRDGKADVGAMAGNQKRFESLNPDFKVLLASTPLPSSIIAISPSIGDLDRSRLKRLLLRSPQTVRGRSKANFGPGKAPDYRGLARQVAEGKAFSSCLKRGDSLLELRCTNPEQMELIEGWIDDVRTDGQRVSVELTTANGRSLTVIASRALLEKSTVFKVLNELKGRQIRLITHEQRMASEPVVIETPHELEIKP